MAMEKTFDAAEAEARLYSAWENAGAFKAGAHAQRDETFTIMIPPAPPGLDDLTEETAP